MKKIIHVLESIPATIIGGIFLIASFVFPKVGMEILGNLAWVTILISGSPLVYAAVKKLIRNKGISKISSALLISVAMIAAVLFSLIYLLHDIT